MTAKEFWDGVKKVLLRIGGAVLAVGVLVIGALIGWRFLRARLAKVIEKRLFTRVPGDPTMIRIWGPSGDAKEVKLPVDGEGMQVTIDKVVAAGYSGKGVISVETAHMPVDRRVASGR